MSEQRSMDRLLAIMARLRDPDGGCPWDVQQNFATIAPYTIEEAYEVADAIERDDMTALREELGDLLLQVVFHARMAEEAGAFAFDDVATAIADKMVARHPHVFADAAVNSATAQRAHWESLKDAERAAKATADGGAASVLDGVALALPALLRAEKLQNRAARVGFDWPAAAHVLDKIEEEVAELRQALSGSKPGAAPSPAAIHEEIGDLLFAVANLARHLDVDPETALRACNAKFARRFAHIERQLAAQGRDPAAASLEEMEALWQQAKRAEKADAAE